MRKIALISASLLLLAGGWFKRAGAGPGATNPLALVAPGLESGDNVRLYLSRGLSGDQPYLEGTLRGFDGTSFEMSGETRELINTAKGLEMDSRQVIRWVPRASVLYIEKTVSEKKESANRP